MKRHHAEAAWEALSAWLGERAGAIGRVEAFVGCTVSEMIGVKTTLKEQCLSVWTGGPTPDRPHILGLWQIRRIKPMPPEERAPLSTSSANVVDGELVIGECSSDHVTYVTIYGENRQLDCTLTDIVNARIAEAIAAANAPA